MECSHVLLYALASRIETSISNGGAVQEQEQSLYKIIYKINGISTERNEQPYIMNADGIC